MNVWDGTNQARSRRSKWETFVDHFGASSENVRDITKASKGPSRTESSIKWPDLTWLRIQRKQTSNLLRKNRKKTRRKLWSLLWNMEDIKKTESVTLKIGEEFSRFRQKAKVFVMYLVKQTKPNVHIPTTAEVGYTLYSRRSRLANNPEKGRAGKRKIKRCSPSVWGRWLKIPCPADSTKNCVFC